jgi:hypothetical protein
MLKVIPHKRRTNVFDDSRVLEIVNLKNSLKLSKSNGLQQLHNEFEEVPSCHPSQLSEKM